MKGYRKPAGAYIELEDGTPVSDQLVEVALRPSAGHVFSAGWAANPLDAAVCWRLKTALEVDAEKGQQADALFSRADVVIVRATVDALYPYLVNPPTRAQLFAAIKARIKDLL